MRDERLARRVGVIALGVIALAVGFFVFVYDRIEWRAHVRIAITFQSISGLREGAPFVVAGKPVGRIESIALAGDRTRVTVAIDADAAAQLRHGDVFVSSQAMLGDKHLELGPAPEDARPLREGDVIAGRDPPDLDRAWQHTWDNLVATARFAATVRPAARALRAEVDRLRVALGELPVQPLREELVALIGESRRIEIALGFDRTLTPDRAAASAVFAQARTTIAELRTSGAVLRAGIATLQSRLDVRGARIIEDLETAIEEVHGALRETDALLAQVAALEAQLPSGSLLQLLENPEWPEDMKELGKIMKRRPWRILMRPAD